MAEDFDDSFGLDNEFRDSIRSAASLKNRKTLRRRAVLLVVFLLLAGGVAGAFFTGKLDFLLKKQEEVKNAAEAMVNEPTVATPFYYDLPEMLVNLNMVGRKPSYLKIRVSLEMSRLGDRERVDAVLPRIIDNFQVYLRELRLEDLQGSSGLLRLREELLVRTNDAVRPTRINDVLFKEILVQ